MKQNYGALRVVRVRPPANAAANLQDKYPSGWLPEERLVHLLTQRETTIGRALNNDIILMDPTVSREHARLVLDDMGWHITNLTEQNVVRVNGHAVPSGGSLPMQPQDILVLGSTMLQLIAPHSSYPLQPPTSGSDPHRDAVTDQIPLIKRPAQPNYPSTVFSDIPSQWRGPGENGRPGLSSSSAPPQTPPGKRRPDLSAITALPLQSEPELAAQSWNEEDEESLLGAGVTMQFALPQRMGTRTRWLIAGIGIAFLVVSAAITLVINFLIGFSTLAQYGAPSLLAAIIIPTVPALCINL